MPQEAKFFLKPINIRLFQGRIRSTVKPQSLSLFSSKVEMVESFNVDIRYILIWMQSDRILWSFPGLSDRTSSERLSWVTWAWCRLAEYDRRINWSIFDFVRINSRVVSIQISNRNSFFARLKNFFLKNFHRWDFPFLNFFKLPFSLLIITDCDFGPKY